MPVRLVSRCYVVAATFVVASFVSCRAQGSVAPPEIPEVEAPSEPEAQALGDAGTTPTPAAWSKDWYVSTAGNDGWPGTSAQPFRTINKALMAASAGQRILVSAGTYPERVRISGAVRSGTATAPIRLQGVGMPKIVPNSTDTGSLVWIEKPYWQVDGFDVDVQSRTFYAAHFTGNVTGSVLSHSNLHHGAAGAGISCHYGCTGATIEDNDIHHFRRTGDSHGILIQPGSKQVTIRRNTIHENSGDSIQCIGPESLSSEPPADGVLIEGNTMYRDNEQAVDIKTCHNVTVRQNVMRDYLQALPGGCAMVVHMSASEVTIENNDIYNVGKAIAIGGNHVGPVPYHVVVKKNRIRNVVKGTQLEGIGIRLENSLRARVFHNTFAGIGHAAIMAGGGVQGWTSDLMIKDNLISTGNTTAYGIYLGSYITGLLSRYNLVAPGTMFSAINSSGARQNVNLSGWQAVTGQDTPSRQVDPLLNMTTLVPGAVAADWGEDVGVPFCGVGPDIGAVETNCPASASAEGEAVTSLSL